MCFSVHGFYCISNNQGRRNSIISGEATEKKFGTFALFPKKNSLVNSQPLISGEALASWLHLFLRPCSFGISRLHFKKVCLSYPLQVPNLATR